MINIGSRRECFPLGDFFISRQLVKIHKLIYRAEHSVIPLTEYHAN